LQKSLIEEAHAQNICLVPENPHVKPVKKIVWIFVMIFAKCPLNRYFIFSLNPPNDQTLNLRKILQILQAAINQTVKQGLTHFHPKKSDSQTDETTHFYRFCVR
jgi:hypothetical protein